MKTIISFVAGIVLLLAVSLSSPVVNPATNDARERVTRVEAEIEVYLLPVCREVRAKGVRAGWQLMDSPAMNQEDYFSFFVFVVGTEVEGSATLGHFAVNKWSGEVWNADTEELVSDSLLAGVQRILIQGHHIHETTVKKYRLKSLWAAKG